MMNEMLQNVEKELGRTLTERDRVTAENMIKRGFDSKSIADTITSRMLTA